MSSSSPASLAALAAMKNDIKNSSDDIDLVIKVLKKKRDALVYAKLDIDAAYVSLTMNDNDSLSKHLSMAKHNLVDADVASVPVSGKKVKVDIDYLLKGIDAKVAGILGSI